MIIDDDVNGSKVSIHAPARGATTMFLLLIATAIGFQSTPLHEGRRCRVRRKPAGTGFNPRPCTRGDPQRS